jgi:plasmid stabilization system protein ParE
MATVTLSLRAFEHLERIFEFVAERDPDRALTTIQRISEAVMLLEHHPLIGRSAQDGLRELVISHGRSAYVALYRWHPVKNAVLVLAIRDARSAGYPPE